MWYLGGWTQIPVGWMQDFGAYAWVLVFRVEVSHTRPQVHQGQVQNPVVRARVPSGFAQANSYTKSGLESFEVELGNLMSLLEFVAAMLLSTTPKPK